MMWTIEECGCFQDDWRRPVGWAVVDEDGAEIEFWQPAEDGEAWFPETDPWAEDEEGDCFDAGRFQDHDDR
jgi:hypothetical protein